VIGGQTLPTFKDGREQITSKGVKSRLYSDVWCSSDGKTWTKVADRCAWGPRGMIGGAAVHRGYMWILGGGTYETPSSPKRTYHNDVWRSKDGKHWQRVLKNAPWHEREYHDVAVWDNKMWVMEGYHEDGGNRSDVWYSEDGLTWTELKGTPWKERHAASLFVYKNALWMVAGNNMESDVWVLYRERPVGIPMNHEERPPVLGPCSRP
jgi:hypothetical protein